MKSQVPASLKLPRGSSAPSNSNCWTTSCHSTAPRSVGAGRAIIPRQGWRRTSKNKVAPGAEDRANVVKVVMKLGENRDFQENAILEMENWIWVGESWILTRENVGLRWVASFYCKQRWSWNCISLHIGVSHKSAAATCHRFPAPFPAPGWPANSNSLKLATAVLRRQLSKPWMGQSDFMKKRKTLRNGHLEN